MEFLQGICGFLAGLLGLYSAVIFVRIIISWILLFSRQNGWRSGNGGYGYNQENYDQPSGIAKVDQVLGKICDPFLNMFRGFKGLRRSRVDFTPLLALVVLSIVRSLLSMFAQYGRISIWTIIAVVISGLWNSFFSLLLFILIVLLIVRLVFTNKTTTSAYNVINALDPILDGPVGLVYKLFYRGKRMDDRKVVITALVFYIVMFILLRWGVSILVNFLAGM
ncbi:MAG: YggT family protein [Spirochaetales bacterium]|nr:YggT family protein [Spirochaetales bacterium]